MCEDGAFDDMLARDLRAETLSRRDFGALTALTMGAALLPGARKAGDPPAVATPAAGASSTTEADVSIATPDRTCDAAVVHRTAGADPAVLAWPDIFGLRPGFRRRSKRLAEAGCAVLIGSSNVHFFIAVTSNDDARQPDAKSVPKEAFAQALLPAEVEVVAGALHWLWPPDLHVDDQEAAERAWARQLALFKKEALA